ncbi:ABC transporter ATP-binding protein [Pseudanabaena sp. PCC 6802]|uniref:ABC transporter ATP-binding protein n=1 Tax=Pseudanabaena sp. PCC 6802 TaxID=118173 RepID=UPI00034B99DE|nr:ABC transporter ATP-binding protein [Pseudanabaena sp. PCC 6802]
MAQVRLEKITKRWQSTDVIEDINLAIPDGEFWVLVGPSGCGKSTILRTIAGLEAPTSGNIYIGDRLVNQIPARQRDVAMVFQNYALYPHMTVAENLAFGLRMRRAEPQTIDDRVLSVAKSLGIDHLLQRKPTQLSGGQQQRVALGRAIARNPQVFLLDEPLSNLDAQLRDDTRAELKLLHQNLGITMIYVTHDQTEAMTMADRIVVLDKGRIQQIGTPMEVYEQPHNLMVATFLGSPPMNIITATCRHDAFAIGEQTIPCPEAWQSLLRSAQEKTVKLGIRPEHLCFSQSNSNAIALYLKAIVVEPLGSETLIRACLPDDPSQILQIKVMGNLPIRPNEPISVQLQLEQLYLFDSHTGDRLS